MLLMMPRSQKRLQILTQAREEVNTEKVLGMQAVAHLHIRHHSSFE
jgi:hypothetical protein